MTQAKVSELKARLSAYLAAVRRGESVIVLDRATPIARLVPFEDHMEDVRIEAPTAPPDALRKLRPVRLRRRVDVGKLLRESRDQR